MAFSAAPRKPWGNLEKQTSPSGPKECFPAITRSSRHTRNKPAQIPIDSEKTMMRRTNCPRFPVQSLLATPHTRRNSAHCPYLQTRPKRLRLPRFSGSLLRTAKICISCGRCVPISACRLRHAHECVLIDPPPDVTPIVCKENKLVQEPPFIYQ